MNKLIELSKIETDTNLSNIQKELEDLKQKNLTNITILNKANYALPLNLQTMLALVIAYNYEIPIVTFIALYQLYANDLIVIAMTILNSKKIDYIFINDSKQILEKLKDKSITLSDNAQQLYNLIIHNIYENKIYIPTNLW